MHLGWAACQACVSFPPAPQPPLGPGAASTGSMSSSWLAASQADTPPQEASMCGPGFEFMGLLSR